MGFFQCNRCRAIYAALPGGGDCSMGGCVGSVESRGNGDRPWAYLTSCVESTGEKIQAMQDTAVDITYRTFKRLVPDVHRWAEEHGYDHYCSRRPGALRLKDDWAVSYHRSLYDGKPCYYLRWSAIEFIWVQG